MPQETIPLGKQLSEFDQALITAAYFGFTPIETPRVTRADRELAKAYSGHKHYDSTEKLSLIRHYMEKDMVSLPHPLTLAFSRSGAKSKTEGYSLHFIGTPSAVAEATLIKTALAILSDLGHKELRLDINCVGDTDSINTYEKELGNYVRKSNIEQSDELKERLKEDVFNLFRLETPEARSLAQRAPSSITFLSADSRNHFKEILEYIDALDIEFRLSPELVGEKNHTSHAIFTIRKKGGEDESAGTGDTSQSDGEIMGIGYRYSHLGKCLGLRKELPMAGVSIFSTTGRKKRVYKRLPRPKFHLIQLGREAKIKTLFLIELLRAHHIPLHHLLGRDKLSSQLSNAENLRVPYLIIIGQKEALENTATVRNVVTRSQETVSIPDLPYYLKHVSV